MEVHTEWRVGTDIMDCWFLQRGFKETRQLVVKGPEEFEWRELSPGDKPAPSLSLPNDVYRALTAKLNGVLPASEATERHLKDTIEVRNRLLDKVVPPRAAH
jgi:hypothetical protein